MEQLRAELSHLLGEKLSRVECVNHRPDSSLWSLYDAEGNPMPLLAKTFAIFGLAQQMAWKIPRLARDGTVRMPAVYGVLTHETTGAPDVLLLERLQGVSVEAPARTPARWEQLKDQIVEGLLAWHRQDSGGCVGTVDSTQENLWPLWYRQRLEVLWSTLAQYRDSAMNMQDRRILFRSRESLPALFEDFSDNCVLIHGNLTLASMLKDPRSDQLLAMVAPGVMLWAPREYELFRLAGCEQSESLLWHYLQRAPVAEGFIGRRWLYLLWDEVARLVNTGRFNRTQFDLAAKSLLPWLR